MNRSAQIFQSSVEAIIIVDKDGKILLANPVSESMFASEKDSLIGVVVEDLLRCWQRFHSGNSI